MNTDIKTKRSPMNILVTLDSNYVEPLTVMLSSLMHSNPGEFFNIYTAHSTLTEEDFERIASSVESSRCRVIPIQVSGELLRDAPVLKRISKETYYRLIAADYLPESVDRVLYIDPDTVIINPIRRLFELELHGCVMAGATHIGAMRLRINRKRLDMCENSEYVNAGVLLMDIAAIRSCITSEQIFAYISKMGNKLYLADQDVINALFCDKMYIIDERILNLDETTYFHHRDSISLSWVKKNTMIVHYNGKYKPWRENYRGKLKGFYDVELSYLNSRLAAAKDIKRAG